MGSSKSKAAPWAVTKAITVPQYTNRAGLAMRLIDRTVWDKPNADSTSKPRQSPAQLLSGLGLRWGNIKPVSAGKALIQDSKQNDSDGFFAGTWFALVGLPAAGGRTLHLLQLTGTAQQLQISAKKREKSHSSSFLSLALMSPMPTSGGTEGVLIKEVEKRQNTIMSCMAYSLQLTWGDVGLVHKKLTHLRCTKQQPQISMGKLSLCMSTPWYWIIHSTLNETKVFNLPRETGTYNLVSCH